MSRCPVCYHPHTNPVLTLDNLPVFCNVLYGSRADATAVTRGTITLTYCPHCGHLFNNTFDANKVAYDVSYENSLHFSPHFQAYATQLAQTLIERHNIRQKQIVGVGSGKGDFLHLLCQLGQNKAVGFDPSYGGANTAQVQFVQDSYSAKYAHIKADMVSCRHVLEHVPNPRQLLDPVIQASQPNTLIFFELPNTLYTLQDMGIWDLIYEHCAYYTPHSLAYAFTQQGLQVQALEAVFGNQFLTIEAVQAQTAVMPPLPFSLAKLETIVSQFAQRFQQKLAQWETYRQQWQNKRVVIWGTGSKGVTFLNLIGGAWVAQAVDINPRKRGQFVAGTGQEIVAPNMLPNNPPDVVIIMNGNYEAEIRQTLATLNLTPDIYLA